MSPFFKDSTITLITRIVGFIFALASGVIISRILGPSLKGSYSIFMLIMNVSSLLVLFGLGSANVYYGARDLNKLPVLAGNSILAAFIFGFIGIIVVEVITFLPAFQNYLAQNHINIELIRGFILLLPLILLTRYLPEILRAKGDILRYNLVTICRYVTNFVAVLILVWWLNNSLQGAIQAWVISLLFMFGLTIWYVLQVTNKHFPINLKSLQSSFAFGIRLYPGNIAQFLNYRLDLFLVALFLSPADVGFYATASGLAEKLWEIPHAVRTVLLHRIAEIRDESTAHHTTARVSRVVIILIGGLCLIIALISYPLIFLLYGEDYLPAVPALIVLMPGIWILSVGKLLSVHLAGRGQPEVGTYGAVISLITTLILDFLLIPKFGIIGASIASSIAYSLATLVFLVFFLRATKLKLKEIILLKRSDIAILRQIFINIFKHRLPTSVPQESENVN